MVGFEIWIIGCDFFIADNWAFIFAQKLALKYKLNLHVCFCLLPTFLDATMRHYDFMLKGLEEVERVIICHSASEVIVGVLGNSLV